MNKFKNVLLAGVALMGFGIGTASADTLDIDPADYQIDMSIFGLVSKNDCTLAGVCTQVVVGEGGFTDMLFDNSVTSDVGEIDIFQLVWLLGSGDIYIFGGGETLGAFEMIATITAFGTILSDTGTVIGFEFFANLTGGFGAIFNDFNAFGEIGIIYRDGFADIVAGPRAVPEPSTLFLLGAGLAGLGLSRRRSKA